MMASDAQVYVGDARRIERLARRARRSRSEVYSAVLVEYAARHAPDEVTEAMNRVCGQVDDQCDGPSKRPSPSARTVALACAPGGDNAAASSASRRLSRLSGVGSDIRKTFQEPRRLATGAVETLLR